MSSPVFIGAFASPSELPTRYDHVYVCIGRSNVGKSSFVNTLTKSTISRTSRTPGRTQTLNAFSYGKHTLLLDLPGYGFAAHAREKRNLLETRIYDTLTQLRPTKIFLLIDACVGITALDEEMLVFLETEHLPHIILANKIDKLTQKERAAQERAIRAGLPPDAELIFCSAAKGTGFGEIRGMLTR